MRGHLAVFVLAMGVLGRPAAAQPRGAWREACAVLVALVDSSAPRVSARRTLDCWGLALTADVMSDSVTAVGRNATGPQTRRIALRLSARFPDRVLRMGEIREGRSQMIVRVRGRATPSYLTGALANVSRRTDGATGMAAEFKEVDPGVWRVELHLSADTRVERVELPLRVTYLKRMPGGPPEPDMLDPDGRTLPQEVWSHPAWPVPAVARAIEIRFDPETPLEDRRLLIEPFEPERIVVRAPGVIDLVLPTRVTPDSVEAMLAALSKDPWLSTIGVVPVPSASRTVAQPTLPSCVDACLDRRRVAHVLLSHARPEDRAFVVSALDGVVMAYDTTMFDWSVLRVGLPEGTPTARVAALRRLPFVSWTEVVTRGIVPEPSVPRRDSVVRRATEWMRQWGRTVVPPAHVFGTLAPGAFAMVTTTEDTSRVREGVLLLMSGTRIGLLSTGRTPLVESLEAFPAEAADRAWVTTQLLHDLRLSLPGYPFLRAAALTFESDFDGSPIPWPSGPSAPPRRSLAAPDTAPAPATTPSLAAQLARVFSSGDPAAGERALAQALRVNDWHSVSVLAHLPDLPSSLSYVRTAARDTLHRACARLVEQAGTDEFTLATIVDLLLGDYGVGQCARRLAPAASEWARDGGRLTDAVLASLHRVAAHPGSRGLRVAVPMAAVAEAFEPLVTASITGALDRALVAAALASCRAGDRRLPVDVRAALTTTARRRVQAVVANLPVRCDPASVSLAKRLVPQETFIGDGLTGLPPR